MLSSAGASVKLCINAQPGPLTITLAWHDYPGESLPTFCAGQDLGAFVLMWPQLQDRRLPQRLW